LQLNNRVMAGSGTFGYGDEFAKRNDVSGFGAIVCKGITLLPRAGNPPPRIVETASGALNAIGLANVGIEVVLAKKVPAWRVMGCPVLVNINGESVDDYVEIARRLEGINGVAGVELNISCPNVAAGGMQFGRDPDMAAEVTTAVRSVYSGPLSVKLTPNTERITDVAAATVAAGAEVLTVANTFLAMAFDAKTGRPSLTNGTGGLSGPAIKPLTLRLVHEVSKAVKVPIIGCGGVQSGRDAAEYLVAGAAAVQVATACLVDPFAVPRIANELSGFAAI
jgi:dihydroorotate dehydrogenase (NAD+) catalytic subunit